MCGYRAQILELRVDLLAALALLDAVFGFSFNGAVRAPFDTALPALGGEAITSIAQDRKG